MMESKLKNIQHDMQAIKVSKFEQHSEAIRPERVLKNVYFKARGRKPGEERTHDSSVNTTRSEFMSRIATTLFDLFAYEIDKNVVLDKEGYKNAIKKSIDDDCLKIICKQHKILKRDLHNFIDASEYEIPTNSNVISFFSNLMHTHFFIVKDNVYSKHLCHDEKVVQKVAVIRGVQITYYTSIELAEDELVKSNCFDSCLFDNKTKFNFMKEYVMKHKMMIPLVECKNRNDLANYLKKLNVHKN